jgi:hypothetical protein
MLMVSVLMVEKFGALVICSRLPLFIVMLP